MQNTSLKKIAIKDVAAAIIEDLGTGDITTDLLGKDKNKLTGQIFFQSSRPLVTAKIGLDSSAFEKLKSMCLRGEPVRPITLYLKISKSREISNGEINISNSDFILNIFDLSWRHPLF